MVKQIFLFTMNFFLLTNSYAAFKVFTPGENITALDYNSNMTQVKQHLTDRFYIYNYDQISSGEIITKDKLENDINQLLDLKSIPNYTITEEIITSKVFNDYFSKIQNHLDNEFLSARVKENHNITLNNNPNQGSYTLTYNGNTATINHSDSISTIQNKLNNLAYIASVGGVTVSGTKTNYNILFNEYGDVINPSIANSGLRYYNQTDVREPTSGSYYADTGNNYAVAVGVTGGATGAVGVSRWWWGGSIVASTASSATSYTTGNTTYYRDTHQVTYYGDPHYKIYRIITNTTNNTTNVSNNITNGH